MRYVILLLMSVCTLSAGTIIQIKDFLCGCDYCKTVDTGEPLDIGRHMIMCHGWRDATLKTMEVMEEMKKAKIEEDTPQVTVPVPEDHPEPQTDPTTGITYDWQYTDQLGPVFADVNHIQFDVDQWLYLEQIEWVWMMANRPEFIFSYDYGWLYVYRYLGHKLYYWYDKRMWVFSRHLYK